MAQLQNAARGVLAWWSAQPMLVRGGVLGAVGVLLGGIVALSLLSGGSGPPPVVASTPTSIVAGPTSSPPSATATPTPTAEVTAEVTATSSPTPEPTATPEPTIGSIEELVSQYGHPPGYDLARIRIPFLGVDAPVGASVVDGQLMGSPEGPATVFWYDLSAWEGLGGFPGGGGNAVFGGHVDLSSYVPYADVTYRGPGVFQELPLLSPGDRIFVDINGESLEYVVQWKEQINAGDGARWGEIWSADVPVDSITLYTCGGDFDWNSLSYADRYVVRATLVGS